MFYYSSLSYLHGGLLAEEGVRWGERVAFYQGASTSLMQAGREAKEYKLEQMPWSTPVLLSMGSWRYLRRKMSSSTMRRFLRLTVFQPSKEPAW